MSSWAATTTCVTMNSAMAHRGSGLRRIAKTAAATRDARVVRITAVPTAKWTLEGTQSSSITRQLYMWPPLIAELLLDTYFTWLVNVLPNFIVGLQR